MYKYHEKQKGNARDYCSTFLGKLAYKIVLYLFWIKDVASKREKGFLGQLLSTCIATYLNKCSTHPAKLSSRICKEQAQNPNFSEEHVRHILLLHDLR